MGRERFCYERSTEKKRGTRHLLIKKGESNNKGGGRTWLRDYLKKIYRLIIDGGRGKNFY